MAVHAPPHATAPRVQNEHDNDWSNSIAGGPHIVHLDSNNPGPSSPPRVNPYHLIRHPDSDELLPPLPPHIERLANGEAATDDDGDSDTSNEGDSDTDSDGEDYPYRPTPTRGVVDLNEETIPNTRKILSQPSPALAPPAADPDDTPNTPAPRRIMKKVSSVFRRDNKDPKRVIVPTPDRQRSPMMQGPPPSPPLSDDEDGSSVAVTEASEDVFHSPIDAAQSQGPEARLQLMPVTEAGESSHALGLDPPKFAISLSTEPEGSSPSSSLRDVPRDRSPIPPLSGLTAPRRVSNGSTSSGRAGSLSMVRAGRLAPQRGAASPDQELPSPFDQPAPEERGRTETRDRISLDTQRSNTIATPVFDAAFGSHMNGSPSSMPLPPRIQRRNTNPTVATQPMIGRALSHSVSISAHAPSQSGQFDDFTLPADILAQTEILRRERLERRQKKMSLLSSSPVSQEDSTEPPASTEFPPARRITTRRKETDETRVLVGNLVGEGHRNYVLMYNMLTGIRVAVSRCQAKIKRPITDEDYLARHKYTFDMLGNELTPSARYDFKFKDYAPWVFRELRDEHFHLDPADYLLSLTAKYILSELGSPGKSGSFFYYSRDYRFIIKTISHSEHNFLRSILKDYHEHLRANPHSLLSRFYGLHRVKIPRGRKIHFVIMNNLFPPHRDIHETYDLKGSAWGREYPEEKAKNNPRAVLKDKNWVNRGRTLEFGPEKRALLTEQLRRDMNFLQKINVMDYSLLVGIHNMERGNRDNLREISLKVFQPKAPNRKVSTIKSSAEAGHIRRAVVRADPQRLLNADSQLPQDGPADRRHFLFYQDEGGLRATDEQNNPEDIIYYLGIIDICTPYNMSKKIEHAWKSMTENPVTISCVDPTTYGNRFLDFLMSVMRGGDPKLRPQGLETPLKPTETSPPVGSELDKGGPRHQGLVIERILSGAPGSIQEAEGPIEVIAHDTDIVCKGTSIVVNGTANPLAETVESVSYTVETEEEAAVAHDVVCVECHDHHRPAIVGHLKAD